MERDDLDLTNSNLLGEEFSNGSGWFKNLTSNIKKGVEDAGKSIKGAVQDVKEKGLGQSLKNLGKEGKKAITKLKDKVGKLGKNFRNRFRDIMRNAITMNIKKNIHGLATKMYPAVASEGEIKSKNYKPKFVEKSKSIYSKILKRWIDLGGKEEDLRNAIKEGQGKRFLKMPYKSVGGNNSEDFYSYITPDMNIYYGDDGSVYCNVEGEENPDTETEEIPDEEEQKKGLKAFFAFILNIFKREKADENPFQEGTTESNDFTTDNKEDEGNKPAESEENNEVISNLLDNAKTDESTGGGVAVGEGVGEQSGDKFLGMPRKVGITVAVVGGIALIIGGVMIARKMKK